MLPGEVKFIKTYCTSHSVNKSMHTRTLLTHAIDAAVSFLVVSIAMFQMSYVNSVHMDYGTNLHNNIQ